MSSEPFREVLPKRGLVFQESAAQLVLCKPKLLPLKSFTLQKLESMQREAGEKAKIQLQQQEQESNEEEEEQVPTHAPETMSFE